MNAFKSALWTALWTFLAMFGLSALDWLQDVAAWASSSGHTPLPGLSVLGYAAVAAVVAAASGLISFVVRFAQSKNVLPGNGPTY